MDETSIERKMALCSLKQCPDVTLGEYGMDRIYLVKNYRIIEIT